MRIGLMADSHDRVPAIAEFGRRFREAGVALVLHAGDYCSPFALSALLDDGLPMAGVFGRNDGDHEGLRAAAAIRAAHPGIAIMLLSAYVADAYIGELLDSAPGRRHRLPAQGSRRRRRPLHRGGPARGRGRIGARPGGRLDAAGPPPPR
jgi:hypothetical protein